MQLNGRGEQRKVGRDGEPRVLGLPEGWRSLGYQDVRHQTLLWRADPPPRGSPPPPPLPPPPPPASVAPTAPRAVYSAPGAAPTLPPAVPPPARPYPPHPYAAR